MPFRSTLLPILIGVSAIFTACTYHGLNVWSPTGGETTFTGVSQDLVDAKRVDVLVVHGMGSPPEGYSDSMMTAIGDALHLTKGTTTRILIDHRHDTRTAAVLRVTPYSGGHGEQMTVHEVTWAPVINGIKHALDYDRTVPTAGKRSLLNRGLKDGLINARLADPVIYLGEQKSEIQFPVKFTLCRVLKGQFKDDRCTVPQSLVDRAGPVVIITESLGSRITFDSIMALRATSDAPTGAAVDRLASRTSHVFMLANQLPLLELASVAPPPDNPEESGRPSPGLAGFLEARQRAEETGNRLMVIAMSDPNDLLSYDIPPAFASRFSDDRFINVDIGVSGFGLLRIASNALKAHVGFEKDSRVINMIAYGSQQ